MCASYDMAVIHAAENPIFQLLVDDGGFMFACHRRHIQPMYCNQAGRNNQL